MRKFLLIGMAVAMLAAPSIASADVQRNQVQTGTLAAHVAYDDLSSVHTYTVEINPCDNTFTGFDGSSRWASNETVSGSINGKDITFDAAYPDGYTWKVASGGNGSDVVGRTFKVTNDLTITSTSNYKNHGEFVKQSADKNDAAHSCIGMPVQSNK
jgi:hypothetical protein